MRHLRIERIDSPLGGPIEVSILDNEKKIGVMKAEENVFAGTISKGEHAIQVEMVNENGRFRSNSYFAIGGKDVALNMTISGSRITLTVK